MFSEVSPTLRKSLVVLFCILFTAITIPSQAIQRPKAPSCLGQQTANMIQAESGKLGNASVIASPSKSLFVYTSGQTFRCGEKIEVFVGGSGLEARKVNVAFFRIGNYLNSELREVEQISDLKVPHVKAPIVNEVNGYYAENAGAILVQQISPTWAPGIYLVGVQIQGKQKQGKWTSRWVYHPFVIAASDSPRVLVAIGSMTTAAYNKWGGKNFYSGEDGTSNSRATAISLSRPLSSGSIRGLVAFANAAEKHESSIGYIQDFDLDSGAMTRYLLHSPPSVIIFPDHSEYFTVAMRKNLSSVIDAGVNIAFLSANSIYWPTIINRDSISGEVSSFSVNKSLGTFAQAGMSEQLIVGQQRIAYNCDPTNLNIPNERNWLFAGIAEPSDVVDGKIIGGEVDEFNPNLPAPEGLQILASTPVNCKSTNSTNFSTVTQYSSASGAGILSIGSTAFTCSLGTICSKSDPGGVMLSNQLLGNIIAKTNHGPAGFEMTRDVTSAVIGQPEVTEPNLVRYVTH
jgi:hypothetical protein